MSNSFLLYKNNESFFQYITINNMFKTFIHIMKSYQHHLTITMEVKHHNSNYYNVGLYRCFLQTFYLQLITDKTRIFLNKILLNHML